MADTNALQVQGLCRFSYLCTGGFQKFDTDIAARRAALYAPERLDQRLLWFTRIALPGVAAQTNPDFTLHLLLGEDFPNPWRDDLMAAIRGVPQIVPHFLPPMNHLEACQLVLSEARDRRCSTVAEFRLDDDDAIAVDYVGRLRRLRHKVQRLVGAQDRIAVDHGRGVVVRARRSGKVRLRALDTQCWAPALAMFTAIDDDRTIMQFRHDHIWTRMPCVSVTDRFMFLRGHHATNDSKISLDGTKRIDYAEDAFPEMLKRRFNVDIDDFRTMWAQLRHG